MHAMEKVKSYELECFESADTPQLLIATAFRFANT